eukprot:1052968-Prymnesium_polylepis.1
MSDCRQKTLFGWSCFSSFPWAHRPCVGAGVGVGPAGAPHGPAAWGAIHLETERYRKIARKLVDGMRSRRARGEDRFPATRAQGNGAEGLQSGIGGGSVRPESDS